MKNHGPDRVDLISEAMEIMDIKLLLPLYPYDRAVNNDSPTLVIVDKTVKHDQNISIIQHVLHGGVLWPQRNAKSRSVQKMIGIVYTHKAYCY